MQFDAKLDGEAAALARAHADALGRLPATLHAFILGELRKWGTLFPAERRYQRALLDHLSAARREDLLASVAGVARVESEAGLDRMTERDPVRFQDRAQGALRRQNLVQAWRSEVDRVFQGIDPVLDSRLYPPDAPRRLVVQLYGSGIAVQPGSLWRRFEGMGLRIPLRLDGIKGADGFLRALFGTGDGGTPGATLFGPAQGTAPSPPDTWVVEAHETLHALCERVMGPAAGTITGLSYDRLRLYREELTRALYRKIQSGVESPQAFAAYARGLAITPRPGALLHEADILHAFVRDVLLTGNGTLFVNNTFVEWAAIQALKRAQPRTMIVRFGVRDRLKPFSSLVLFSQPRTSDNIPLVEDPVGSFVDVEQLSYYVWLNAEKSPAYRAKTLYLFLAEGIDEMLALRSDPGARQSPVAERKQAPASLPDVCATMAQWLGAPLPPTAGTPIAALLP